MTSSADSLKDKLAKGDRERLTGLLKTAEAELLHLQQTDARLFGNPFSPEELVLRLQVIDFSVRRMTMSPCWPRRSKDFPVALSPC